VNVLTLLISTSNKVIITLHINFFGKGKDGGQGRGSNKWSQSLAQCARNFHVIAFCISVCSFICKQNVLNCKNLEKFNSLPSTYAMFSNKSVLYCPLCGKWSGNENGKEEWATENA